MSNAIQLANVERMELQRRAASRTGRAEEARRARLILLLSEGHTWDEACERVPCSRGFVSSWTKRFEEQRLAGLYSRHIGQVATVLTPQLEARILEATCTGPKDGTTHWSTRRLGEHLGVSHMMVARVWRKHGLKPHGLERYMASNDPDFEKKAADVIDEGAAMTYGDVRASLEQQGKPIDPLDTLIGGHAHALDIILVTHNTREFSRIDGLRLEDWIAQ